MRIGTRRQFLEASLTMAGTGLLAACDLLPGAKKVPRVGLLANADSEPVRSFRRALAELGYVDGQTMVVEARFSEGNPEQFPALAADLVALSVDVLAVVSKAATSAAQRATSSIPIVMMGATSDPVGDGYVASLARPGGNITGLSGDPPEVIGKRVELLKQVAPTMSRLGVLLTPAEMPAWGYPTLQAAAGALGLQAQPLAVQDPADFDRAFAAVDDGRIDALYVFQLPIFYIHRERIWGFVARKGLPVMYAGREWAGPDGLLSYAVNFLELYRRAAGYVDRILKGALPATLPVERPARFDFVVNLRTALALRLDIPQSILMQATELIQ